MSGGTVDSRERSLLVGGLVVSLIATAGSLFLSVVWGLAPCELCWYQRILMYPLVVVFGVGLYEQRPAIYRTVIPLSVPGGIVASYHSWLQAIGGAGACGLGGGCSAVQYRLEPVGLTVPNLALIAFVLLTAVALALRAR